MFKDLTNKPRSILPRVEIFEDHLNIGLQNRKIDICSVPNLLQIDPKIVVDENVSHSYDVGPGDIGMFFLQGI